MLVRSLFAPLVIGAVALTTFGVVAAPAAFAAPAAQSVVSESRPQVTPDLPLSSPKGVEFWMTNTTSQQFVVESAQCFRTYMAPGDLNYCQGRSPANPVDVGAVIGLPDGTRQLIQGGNPGVGLPWVSIGPSGRVKLSVGQSQNYDFGAYRFVVTRKDDNGNSKSFDIQIRTK